MRVLAAIALLFWMSVTLVVAAEADPPPDTRVDVPAPTEKALEYFRGNTAIWGVNVVLGIAIPATILFTGLSARIRDLAVRMHGGWSPKAIRGCLYALVSPFALTARSRPEMWRELRAQIASYRRPSSVLTVVIYVLLYLFLVTVVTLPLDYWAGFVRQHAYDLSNQTLAKWITDQFRGFLVSAVIFSIGAVTLYVVLWLSPRLWWLWTSLVAAPMICVLVLLSPIVIDPLFNKFGPMKDKALEAKILSLADRAGIEGSRVYEVEKSEDTKAVNAYVTGFGNSKRVVLWDTTLRKLDERQILFVMGHEMGHYVLGHIRNSLIVISFGVFFGLLTVHLVSGRIIGRLRERIGFDALSDVASLPLLLLIFVVLSLVTQPAILAYSRWQEHEADRFGLEITHDNWAGASAFVRLQQENLGVPRPGTFYKIFRASHPTLGDRVDFCNEYRPWETGAPERYSSRFRTTP